MKWNKYRMKTTTEAVDLISYTLGEMGIEGIEIEDKIPLSDEDKKKCLLIFCRIWVRTMVLPTYHLYRAGERSCRNAAGSNRSG